MGAGHKTVKQANIRGSVWNRKIRRRVRKTRSAGEVRGDQGKPL